MTTINKRIGTLTLSLVLIFAAVAPINAQDFGGRMSTKKKTAIIAGSAVAGAVIGGLLGGKKGAVVGGLLGGGGGTGYVYYKGRQDDRYGYYGYRDYRYRNYRNYDRNYGRYDGRGRFYRSR
jgi:hypothetical protein